MAVSKELEKTLKEINKKYGAGTITTASKAVAMKIKRIPTGSFTLDVETGGGYPEGRITLIAGPFSSGKTFLALHGTAQAQKKYPNKVCVWIDQEGTFDNEWAEQFGIDLARLEIVRPATAEHAWDILVALIQSPEIAMVVLDSLAAMVSIKALEKSAEDSIAMGGNAKMNNEHFAKATAIFNMGSLEQEREQPAVLVINQLRDTMDKYKPEIMPGGRGQEFFSSITLWVRTGDKYHEKREGIKDPVYIGHAIKFKTEKNKTFAPKRTGEFDIYVEHTDKGFRPGQVDRLKEVMTYAVYWGAIEKRGAWFFIDGVDEKFQGGASVLEFLRSNPEWQRIVESRVMELAMTKKKPSSNEPVTYVDAQGRVIDNETGEIVGQVDPEELDEETYEEQEE